jgi:hypothetical protein
MAQSGPCSRWLVALSTLDAAGSRAGGGPIANGYITSSAYTPLSLAAAKSFLPPIPARARELCVIRSSRNSSIRTRRGRRRAGGLGRTWTKQRKRGRRFRCAYLLRTQRGTSMTGRSRTYKAVRSFYWVVKINNWWTIDEALPVWV